MKLQWKAIVVGDEDPRYFQYTLLDAPRREGWTSEANPVYPMDIVLRFYRKCRIHKIELGIIDRKCPYRIHAKIGNSLREPDRKARNSMAEYIRARRAQYSTTKYQLEFEYAKPKLEELAQSFRVESISFEDEDESVGEYLWLIVDAPMISRHENSRNQVHLSELNIYGSEFGHHQYHQSHSHRYRHTVSTSSNSSTSSSTKSSRCSIRSRNCKERHNSGYGSQRLGPINKNHTYKGRTASEPSRRSKFRPNEDLPKHSSLYRGGDFIDRNLNYLFDKSTPKRRSDVLITVENLLRERYNIAVLEGRDVTSALCQSAIENIKNVENEMGEVSAVLRAAEGRGDKHCANRCRKALKEILESYFRSIHMDLIIGNEMAQRLLCL